MPNWKKVAVSGSSPVFSNITASGNISASGDVYADNLIASGNISASLTSTGSFGRLESHTIGGLSPVTITDDTTIEGNITASGNIQIGFN